MLPALNAILEVFSDLFDSDADFSALFDVIGVGIRGIAFAVLGVTKAIDELVRLITTAFKIVDAARKFDFGEVGKLGQEYGVGVAKRFQVSREQFNKILFGTSEVGVDYGGGGRDRGGRDRGGRDPSSVTEQLDKVTEETSGNTKVQVSAEVLRLTKEINTARLAGNRLAEVDLGYDLAIQQLKEKGLTGNNLELEQSNLLTQYTLDRLNAVHGLADAQDDLNEKTDKYKITLDQVKDTLANQMTSVIEGLIDGTKSLGESLSGVLRQMASLFLQAGIGSFKGDDGKGGSGLLGLFANGGVIAKNKVVPFAYGGVVNKPTLFPMANGAGLMGEAGPEAIMPLRRGPGGRLGVESSGGVGNVVVNVDASGSSAQGDQPNAKALGQVIGAAVQAELIKQKRPGGLLS